MSQVKKEEIPAKLHPLKALDNAIAAAKSAKDLLSIDLVRNRYIANYEAASGRSDGQQRCEQETYAFMEIVNNNPDIMQCDPFSIFAGFVKSGSWNLSWTQAHKIYARVKDVKQKDGSFKKVLSVESSAHGKKEMLENMPNIKRILPAQVVFNKDVFSYSPLKKEVTKHEQTFPLPNPSEETVIAAYSRIEFTDGTHEDVLLSLEELKKARAASKMQDGGKLWVTHYGEAAKKSVYNRMYKEYYKKPDTAVLFPQHEPKEETIDASHTEYDENDENDAHLFDANVPEQKITEEVDESTGEITVVEEAKVEKPKSKSGKQESFI